jgi:hypothetical protein
MKNLVRHREIAVKEFVSLLIYNTKLILYKLRDFQGRYLPDLQKQMVSPTPLSTTETPKQYAYLSTLPAWRNDHVTSCNQS